MTTDITLASVQSMNIHDLNILINQLSEAMDSDLPPLKKIQLNRLITKCHVKVHILKNSKQ